MNVLLDPANPHDFSRAELEELAEEIRAVAPGTEVVPAFRPEEGYGGPLHEVLYIWHESKEGVETAVLLGAAVKWMKRRWDGDRDKHPDKPRARSVVEIEEERIVRRIKIDLPDGDASEDEVDDKRLPHGKPTPDDGT
jgi:hypothetical protein